MMEVILLKPIGVYRGRKVWYEPDTAHYTINRRKYYLTFADLMEDNNQWEK